jgi:penicillin-binding protein 2
MDKRITIAVYIVGIVFLIFLVRLWSLQVIRGQEYKKIDERNRLRVLDIPAPRGIIYDRNNKALVKNIPTFDITAVKEDLSRDTETLTKLGELIGLTEEEILDRLASAKAKPFEPVTLKQDISFKNMAKVEARKMNFPGLQVNVVGGREYIYGHASSHVLGYLGRLSLKQMRLNKYRDIPGETFIGQYGVEKNYDEILRGISGKKVIEVDAVGSIIKIVRIQRPVKGRDIKLTIDIDLQIEAEKSLQGKTGAVVALRADTGAVLALASSPSFDPNVFVRGIDYKDWKKLVNDPQKPLLNRTIQGQYAPGSTFKLITALAALEQGIITKDTGYYCKGSLFFGREFGCWKKEGHGYITLHNAIVESCDVYFYEIGKKLNIDILAQYAMGYGLGRPTGIKLDGELPGIVPTSGWKLETKGERWYTGETLNTVIGQGYLSVTPVQMARLTAAVVNGGNLYEPYLIMDASGPRSENVVSIKPYYADIIKKAMLGVVSDKHGTGWKARSDIVRMGGKTGTTQVVSGVTKDKKIPAKFRDHAWFIAFAPEEQPQIAVAVLVEHGGHGSTGAAPIAKKIIETYYARDDKEMIKKMDMMKALEIKKLKEKKQKIRE